MNLSTGKIAFPIEFDNGDIETIYFNPDDRDFIKRMMDIEESLSKRIQKIELSKIQEQYEKCTKINLDALAEGSILDNDEIADIREKAKILLDIDAEFQKAIKDELNEIFNDDVSAKVFKYSNPLDMVATIDEKGKETHKMVVEIFLHAFNEEIKKHQRKITPAMKKHLDKYEK